MKRFNFNQLLWLLIILGLLISIGFLFISKRIYLLVAIKSGVSILLTLAFLFIIGIIQINEIFTIPSRGGVKKGYILFIVVILSLITVSKIDILKQSLIMKGVVITHSGHSHGKGHGHDVVKEDNKIVIRKDNFHSSIEAINEDIDSYENEEIKIEGLLYTENVEKGDFIITEIDMNCCMADSSFLGITCLGDIGGNIKTGDYVEAKGILKVIEHNGDKIGAIYISEIKNKY